MFSLRHGQLFKATQIFNNEFSIYDKAWLDAYNNVDWNNFGEFDNNAILNNVIGFLNRWKCRLPYSNDLAEGILNAYLASASYIINIKHYAIEDWAPNEERIVDSQKYTNSELLFKIFNQFSSIGYHFNTVATSKLLHFLLPKLVVMWDNKIADHYMVPMTSRAYVERFIPIMFEKANEAIINYQKEKGCNRSKAIEAINSYSPPKTIAKMLDEYNYLSITTGRKIDTTFTEVLPTEHIEEQSGALLDLFSEFKRLKNFKAGEGLTEKSLDSWMRDRRLAKERYREAFSPDKLWKLSESDFLDFLRFKHNRSWTQLYRQGTQLVDNMAALRKVIAHLQDENIPVETRINDVMLNGKFWIHGLGKNLVTGILHICDTKDRYGVWNNRTEDGLKGLNRMPRFTSTRGIMYSRINSELLKFKKELETDLVMIDGFMWFLSKRSDYAI